MTTHEVTLTMARTSLHVRGSDVMAASRLRTAAEATRLAEFDVRRGHWVLPLESRVVETFVSDLGSDRDLTIRIDGRAASWLSHSESRIERARAVRAAKDVDMVYPLAHLLDPYQRVMAAWMVASKCCICADEMGLGKTIEALAAASELCCTPEAVAESPNVLVICKKGSMDDWVAEADRWLVAPGISRTERLSSCAGLSRDTSGLLGVINWDKVASRLKQLSSVRWDVVIVDESHRMKNASSARGKAVRKIYGRHRWLLSGTPAPNGPAELWHQLNYVDPGRFPSYWRFVDRFLSAKSDIWGHVEVGGIRDDARTDWEETSVATFWPRTADDEDVDLQLPSVRHIPKYVDLGRRQRKAYDEMLEEFVVWIDEQDGDEIVAQNWMTQSLRLKQLAGGLGIFSEEHRDSAKIEGLFDLLDEAPPTEKWVVMSQFRTMTSQVATRLQDAGVPFVYMAGGGMQHVYGVHDGPDRLASRRDLCVRFNQDPEIRVFLSTLQTGGESITLTGARRFVFLDHLWVPGENDQAWKRVHRRTQTRTCYVYHLLARDTIDTKAIMPRLRSKRQLVASLRGPDVRFDEHGVTEVVHSRTNDIQ